MADYAFIVQTGTVVPDTADLRDTVENEFKEAFGADIPLTANTPQGLLVTAEALARDAVARNNADLANQINPDLAGGVFLDAIWALTGGQRIKASSSLITGAVLGGVSGTIVPAGARARVGVDGAIFALAGTVQLNGAGVGVGNFLSVEDGPIAAPAGTLDHIVDGVLGWETITNPDAAELGVVGESDLASRTRRRNTLALQTVSIVEATVSGLFDVEDVRSVLYRENFTNDPVTIEGVTLAPHSIYVCVEGGTDADVAASLLRTKSAGCGWNGSTTVNTVEPTSGQTYPVTFDRPDAVEIFAEVTVRLGSAIGDPAPLVRAAIVAYAAGFIEGEDGFIIGADVSPWELGGAVTGQTPGLYVQLVKIGTSALSLSTNPVPITITEIAKISEGNIAVVVV